MKIVEKLRKFLGLIFYVYVYLDPRKPGKFKYGEFEFDFEPYYVGKGGNNRLYDHLIEAGRGHGENQYKIDKINEILAAGFTGEDLKKYIIKYREDMSDSDAYALEEQMILTIGRFNSKTNPGPLTNHNDGGMAPPRMYREKHPLYGRPRSDKDKKKIGDGNRGKKRTEEQNRRKSESMKGKNCGKNHPKGELCPIYGGKNGTARAVTINGVDFPAISVAARELDIGYDKLRGWLQKGKEGYSYADENEDDRKARRKANTKQRRDYYGKNNPMWGLRGELCPNYGEKNGMWGLKGELCPNYGEKNGMYNKRHTEETKRKQRESKLAGSNPNARAVIANGKPFSSIIEAITTVAKELNITKGAVYYRLQNGKPGYCYADETDEDRKTRRRRRC